MYSFMQIHTEATTHTDKLTQTHVYAHKPHSHTLTQTHNRHAHMYTQHIHIHTHTTYTQLHTYTTHFSQSYTHTGK